MRRVFQVLVLSLTIATSANSGIFDDAVDFVGSVTKVVVPIQPAIDIVRGKKTPDEAVVGVVNDVGQAVNEGVSIVRTIDHEAEKTIQDVVDAVPGDVANIAYEIVLGPNRYLKEALYTGADGAAAVLKGQDPLVAFAFPLAAAIRDGRNQFHGSSYPLPEKVKRALTPIIPADVLNKARIAVGEFSYSLPSAIDLAGTVSGDHRDAVTLDNVIVFLKEPDFETKGGLFLLVHELYHVYQYSNWGVDLFAYRYLKNYAAVEAEAERAEAHAASFVNQIVNGSAMTMPTIAAGQVSTEARTVQTPLGPTTIQVAAATNAIRRPFGGAILTDRCVVSGEHVVLNSFNQVFSLPRNGIQVGERIPPVAAGCVFEMLSSTRRYCVNIANGLVFQLGWTQPVGRCMPCYGAQCLQ